MTKHIGNEVLVPLKDAAFLFNISKEYGNSKIALEVWFKKHRPKEKIEFENLDLAEKVGYIK